MAGRNQGEWESLRLGRMAGCCNAPRSRRESRGSVWYFAMAGALGALVAAAPTLLGHHSNPKAAVRASAVPAVACVAAVSIDVAHAQ